MAKVTGPLLSLDASGTVAKTMTFSRWKGINYVRQRVIPTYTNTAAQVAVRLLLKDASLLWKSGGSDGVTTIDSAYKAAYDAAASGTAQSGFNTYIKECMQKNGGSSYDTTLEIPTVPGDIS